MKNKSKLQYRALNITMQKPDSKSLKKINDQLANLIKLRRSLKVLNKLTTLKKENQDKLKAIRQAAGVSVNLVRQELTAENSCVFRLEYNQKPLFIREKSEQDDPNDPDTFYTVYKYIPVQTAIDIKLSSGINHVHSIKEGARQIEQIVRETREQMRTPDLEEDTINFANTTFKTVKIGGVYETPKSWLEISETKMYQKCYENKAPKNDAVHLGVEIELYCKLDRDSLARELTRDKLQNHVNITTDQSLKQVPKDCTHAHELRILAEEKDMASVINRVCKVLNSSKVGAQINRTCGVHVHLDMRQMKFNKDLVFHNLVNCQGLLFSLVPPSRRGNKFCTFVESNLYENSNHHHSAISGRDAYGRHKTFEVRIHSGSLNASKINNWIQLLLLIKNNTMQMPAIESLTDFEKNLNVTLTPELRTYIEDRVQEVNKSEE
jgi:hypothetical protein